MISVTSRSTIKSFTKEGANAKEIDRLMADVYCDSSTKYFAVAKWSAEFKRGRDSLEDGLDRRITIDERASGCGIYNWKCLHHNP